MMKFGADAAFEKEKSFHSSFKEGGSRPQGGQFIWSSGLLPLFPTVAVLPQSEKREQAPALQNESILVELTFEEGF